MVREDIIVYSRLASTLDKCKVVIFSKRDCSFEFKKTERGWLFGKALFQTSDLVFLIVKAENAGFKVFMKA